jgi:Uncharacterised nucleotidyltransferase
MVTYGEFSLDRMERAVAKVRERLLRATAALESAGIPYAVAGGNAVAAWVSRVDEAAVRNTQDVDILVRRSDFPKIVATMEAAGFFHAEFIGVEMFLDGPNASPRDAVHLLFAGEKVRAEYAAPAADVSESEQGPEFRTLQLESLVRMKLTSYRRKDQVHVLDMIGVGLIDATWPARFPPPLAARLQELIDHPDG